MKSVSSAICPHCKKKNCIREVAKLNAETYGSRTFNLCCTLCKMPIRVYIHRVLAVETDPIETTFEKDDWGEVPARKENQ